VQSIPPEPPVTAGRVGTDRALRAIVHPWFVTTQFVARDVERWDLVAGPAGLRHAKTFGTSMTRCGINAASWQKFWDRSFIDETSEVCPQCSEGID
jgi:hypothetical protein